jgi:hypothetical protein
MKRVAFLIKGAVSKVTGKFDLPGQLYREGEYINYVAAYNSIVKHFIEPNSDYKFDFFIHSWNPDLQENLTSLYKPVAYKFEDNNLYKEIIISKLEQSRVNHNSFAIASHSLSIKLGCELIDEWVKTQGISYDLVILYRPDILIWKNVILSEYDVNCITLNNYQDYRGDFHFIMNYENMLLFKDAWDSISTNNPPLEHKLFPKYIQEIIRVPIRNDNIIAGEHQAPIRYIHTSMIASNKLKISDIIQYGFTEEELRRYVNIY